MTETVRVGFFGEDCSGIILQIARLLDRNGIKSMTLNRNRSWNLEVAFEGSERLIGVPIDYKSTLYIPGSMSSGMDSEEIENLGCDNSINVVLTQFGYESCEVFDELDLAVVVVSEDKTSLRRLEALELPKAPLGLFVMKDYVRMKAAAPMIKRSIDSVSGRFDRKKVFPLPYSEKDRRAELLSIYNEHVADVRLSICYRRILDAVFSYIGECVSGRRS